jgi:hypothetical protein
MRPGRTLTFAFVTAFLYHCLLLAVPEASRILNQRLNAVYKGEPIEVSRRLTYRDLEQIVRDHCVAKGNESLCRCCRVRVAQGRGHRVGSGDLQAAKIAINSVERQWKRPRRVDSTVLSAAAKSINRCRRASMSSSNHRPVDVFADQPSEGAQILGPRHPANGDCAHTCCTPELAKAISNFIYKLSRQI